MNRIKKIYKNSLMKKINQINYYRNQCVHQFQAMEVI